MARMARMAGALGVVLLLTAATASRAHAQQGDDSRALPDSAIARARQMADAGDDVGARRVIDSLFRATSPDSASYAEVLYWRATLAPAAVDAERDYRRLLIEAPLSARAEDAMLRLATLEQARGDRRAASDHLQRFLLSYPANPERPRAAVTLVRLLFEQGQAGRGCEALRTGRDAVPAENAELRNQLEFYAPRCVSFESIAAADSVGASPARPDTAAGARAPRRATPKLATAPPSTARAQSSYYSVQVAAYDSAEPAGRMARLLLSRGLEARVDGTTRPFRVRVGKYATRAEAVKAEATLKSQGITGFIALVR